MRAACLWSLEKLGFLAGGIRKERDKEGVGEVRCFIYSLRGTAATPLHPPSIAKCVASWLIGMVGVSR